MRWVIAGLLFALAVALAIGTAAIRAGNVRMRHSIDRGYNEVQDRVIELRRLSMARVASASPQRLAALQWQWIEASAARQRESLQ